MDMFRQQPEGLQTNAADFNSWSYRAESSAFSCDFTFT